MNRFNNVLNIGPLGSGESTAFIYVQAQLICRATYSAVLRTGFRCRSSITAAAQVTARLYAGRRLKSSVDASAANTTAVLHCATPVHLAASQNASASITAVLSRRARVYMSAAVNAAASVVARLRMGRLLKSAVTGFGTVVAYLNESSRTRAAADRIIYIQNESRTSVVPKGK